MMGALPKLPKKVELRYRKGSTNESNNCRYCVQFVENFEVRDGIGLESRCRIFGLRERSRYKVRQDYTCDAQEFDGTDFSGGKD
jgi:hypothetical protein